MVNREKSFGACVRDTYLFLMLYALLGLLHWLRAWCRFVGAPWVLPQGLHLHPKCCQYQIIRELKLQHLLEKTPLFSATHRNNFLHGNKSFFGLICSGGGWVSTPAGNQSPSYCMLIWLQVKGSCYLRKKLLYLLYHKLLFHGALLFYKELKSSDYCSSF